MRKARDFEVLVSEAPGMLSRAAGYESAGTPVLAADLVIPDYVPASAVGTVDVIPATAITNGQKVKIVTGGVDSEFTAGAGANTVADLIAHFEAVRPGLVSIVAGKLVARARGDDSITVSGTASAALFGTGLAGTVTRLDTYRPVTTADTLDPTVIAQVSVALATAFDGGFARLFQLAEVKDQVVRWPESADADADHAAKVALIGALANRHIITR